MKKSGKTITLPDALWDRLESEAKSGFRSLNQQVLMMLSHALDEKLVCNTKKGHEDDN